MSVFPEPLRQAIVSLGADGDYDDITSISFESEVWGSTALGLGGIGGQAITGGWVVNIQRGNVEEVWHVSNFGGARKKE